MCLLAILVLEVVICF